MFLDVGLRSWSSGGRLCLSIPAAITPVGRRFSLYLNECRRFPHHASLCPARCSHKHHIHHQLIFVAMSHQLALPRALPCQHLLYSCRSGHVCRARLAPKTTRSPSTPGRAVLPQRHRDLLGRNYMQLPSISSYMHPMLPSCHPQKLSLMPRAISSLLRSSLISHHHAFISVRLSRFCLCAAVSSHGLGARR